jgi:TPR repeat protein
MKRIVTSVALAVALCVLPLAAMADARTDAGFAAAEDYDYARALEHFRAAGEAGDVHGARIAGFMLLYGETLYGPAVKRDRAAAIKLLQTAAAGGCEVSAATLRKVSVAGVSAPPVASAAH